MLVIGIHNTGILSSAAILQDGSLVYGAAEERFTRQKYSKYFPMRAIEAGLTHCGARLEDVDCFAIGWNPAINIAGRYRAGWSEWPAHPGARFFSNPNHLLPQLGFEDYAATDQIFHRLNARPVTVSYVAHHLAHCANAYYLSGFPEAAILSCDGYGERTATVWATAREGRIEIIRRQDFPQSLGSFYSAVTEFLGFRPDLDEWKVMGAGAFGDPERYRSAMERLLHIHEDGSYALDFTYYNHFDFESSGLFSKSVSGLLGQPRRPEEDLSQRHFDIAAAAQARLEKALFAALEGLHQATGLENLCLAGGVAMNSVFNGKAALRGPFRNVFVPFAPDDSGNSIGAALWAAIQRGETLRLGKSSSFLGSAYSDAEIKAALERFKCAYQEFTPIAEKVAALLSQGKIVGWFQGRMEFGQRALGARSILADPRDPAMKDRVNASVKFREAFRPFAPAVLAEAVDDWFETPPGADVPFMEKVFPVRAHCRSLIPAVVHGDGTGRLQTVSREGNQPLRPLIEAFAQMTDVPVILNTSFNLNGEPIVESPADAIRTFFTSGLDALALGSFLLTKE